jgi:hypothetical protein
MSPARLEQIGSLVGYTVVGAVTSSEDRDFYGLLMQKGKSRKIVWILRDDEGNGPGAIDIQDKEDA